MNHIRTMRAQYDANRQKVLQLLGWDMLQYATLQYETGLQYLQQYLQLDAATLHMFESSRRWWDWWVNQWNLRDAQVFLPHSFLESKGIITHSEMMKFYHAVHDVWFFDHYPHAHLMQQSYNDMTRKLYADLKKQQA